MPINNKTIQDLRLNYILHTLDESKVHIDPTEQFKIWFQESLEANCLEPNAMTLSTLDGHKPRSRIVLFKGIDVGGIVFYSNYNSSKGKELISHPFASLVFFWPELQRQVRIEGVIKMTSPELSDQYFASRPRGSQIGAHASVQSSRVSNRRELEESFRIIDEKFKNDQLIPRPENWGGFLLIPQYFEYWQGRENRMHDRIAYSLEKMTWKIYRLSP